jgi:hypothetical protein
MALFQAGKIAVVAALIPLVFQLALVSLDQNAPGVFVIGMTACALVVAVALRVASARPRHAGGKVGRKGARAYALRAQQAEMRRRQADLKAYQVLVPVPVTEEHHATLRQLSAALDRQRALVEAHTTKIGARAGPGVTASATTG